MKNVMRMGALITVLIITGCALTPEQQAAREVKRIQAQQAAQVQLAKQCDLETAQVMEEYFQQKDLLTGEVLASLEQRYLAKVDHPIFQACYKLALENEKTKRALDEMRYEYWDRPFRYGFPRFCYSCW